MALEVKELSDALSALTRRKSMRFFKILVLGGRSSKHKNTKDFNDVHCFFPNLARDCGKSNLILRLVGESFIDGYVGSLGVDFKIKFVPFDGAVFRLQIWEPVFWILFF